MAELGRIQSSWFLILALQITDFSVSGSAAAATGRGSHFTVRDGASVALPCGDAADDRDATRCGAGWLFRDQPASPLVALGEPGPIRGGVRSDGLSVAANCSLVIEKVAVGDAGLYTCRQSQVHLSVINIHEVQDEDKVTLTCSVLTHGDCRHSVEWLSRAGKGRSAGTEASARTCSATVTFATSDRAWRSEQGGSLGCKVTGGASGDLLLLLCGSDPLRWCENTAIPDADRDSATRNEGLTDPQGFPHQWLFVATAVGLATFLIIVGALVFLLFFRDLTTVLTSNPSGAKTSPETSQVKAEPEDGVSYASISFTKTTESKARAQANVDADDEGDAVTYSSVKPRSSSSSPTGAPTSDPSGLHSAIN